MPFKPPHSRPHTQQTSHTADLTHSRPPHTQQTTITHARGQSSHTHTRVLHHRQIHAPLSCLPTLPLLRIDRKNLCRHDFLPLPPESHCSLLAIMTEVHIQTVVKTRPLEGAHGPSALSSIATD